MITFDSPILAQIQPQCEAFFKRFKDEKKLQGKTNQDIADATGIPVSHISKYLSGNLANPNLYNAAAVCKYLGISIDEVFHLKSPSANKTEHINELEIRVHDLQKDLEHCRKDCERLESELKSRKMIITALFGTVILLIAAFGFGVIYDSVLPDVGFIQGEHIAGISILLITVIVLAIAVTILIIGNYVYKKEKR